ncbi:Retrovirus-related Pol polyprotein from transposon opus [Eumeta japonica]|uniref:Retrovirus-related Pol polyprotein from transposon opus n=1 Tax=Eumeta variegata TaxID=151549 RepID=A0A4C2A935_EUMVA|nr:Retrovirus-related Pol polyprotein from transposon opus [Eumeta japonica]
MAKLVSPIIKLCQEALNKVKNSIANPPILIYLDFTQPFRLTTDASNEALGSVFSQIRNNRDHSIAFASRTLSDVERRHSTTEKKCLVLYGQHIHSCHICIYNNSLNKKKISKKSSEVFMTRLWASTEK